MKNKEKYTKEIVDIVCEDVSFGVDKRTGSPASCRELHCGKCLLNIGKKRYARDAREKEFNKYDESSGKYYKQSKKNGRNDLEFDAARYAKEDTERSKRLVDSSRNLSNDLKRTVDISNRNRKVPKMDLSNMTDQEMRSQINREILERQYNDMFNPRKESKGREYASKTLETAGNVLAVTSSALGIALAIKELKG